MLRVGGLLLAVFIVFSPVGAAANMFGYGETRYTDIRDFKKWRDVLQRHEIQVMANSVHLQQWNQRIEQLAKLPSRADQIVAVNKLMNDSITYDDDIRIWGKSDFWATPAETFSKGYGDCDDYAVAKYLTLKRLGFTDNEMRVVVLKDTRKNELHAVLSVSHNGSNYILDNQNKQVLADYQITHYQPIYSINQLSWWKHS